MGDFNNTKKVCGFYVSSMHLITMILPYIKKQTEKNIKIQTVLEFNLKENVSKVLSKLVIKEEEKQKILNINWENTKIEKYSSIEKKLNKILEQNKKINILISGSKRYISEINNILNKFLSKNYKKLYEKDITIINCFEVNEFDNNIREILDSHEFILNTSGVHKIEDIFEDYKKKRIT